MPARGESGPDGDATSTHGVGAVRQSISPCGVATTALTRACVVNAPVASGSAHASTHRQLVRSGPGAHCENWTSPGTKPAPVTVTVWPWTRPVAGATVRVGGTTSVAGSNVTGTTAVLAGASVRPAATATMQAPATRQSTAPDGVSSTANNVSGAEPEVLSYRSMYDHHPRSQSSGLVAPTGHCNSRASVAHTTPCTATVTTWPCA
jgi:hypothetical protein